MYILHIHIKLYSMYDTIVCSSVKYYKLTYTNIQNYMYILYIYISIS